MIRSIIHYDKNWRKMKMISLILQTLRKWLPKFVRNSTHDFTILIPWSPNFSFSITRWIQKWPRNRSIFKWNCVIFSRILFFNRKRRISGRFWENATQEKFLKLRNFSLEMLSLFGSTYVSVTLYFPLWTYKEIALIVLLINHVSDCLWQEYQLISINLLHKTGSIISLTILV
jgi:hypothetical protein